MLKHLQLTKDAYHIDEIIIILLVNLLFFFFIVPFIVFGLFSNSPSWVNYRDMIFLKNILGFYNYVLHALVLLFTAFIGSVLGFVLSLTIWRIYIGIPKEYKEIDIEQVIITKYITTYVLISSLLILINHVGVSIVNWWPTEIPLYLIIGFWLGGLLMLHIKLTKIYKSLLVIKLVKKHFKLSIILGVISTLSFISLGLFLTLTKEKLFFIQTPVLSTVIGVNIVIGLFMAINVLLIRYNHIYSGSIMLIIFSYLSIGVGGGFIVGCVLGILSGVFGLMSLNYQERIP